MTHREALEREEREERVLYEIAEDLHLSDDETRAASVYMICGELRRIAAALASEEKPVATFEISDAPRARGQGGRMTLERTMKCPICGRAYKVYAHYAGDQSACPACVAEAEQAVRKPDTTEQKIRRARRFR